MTAPDPYTVLRWVVFLPPDERAAAARRAATWAQTVAAGVLSFAEAAAWERLERVLVAVVDLCDLCDALEAA